MIIQQVYPSVNIAANGTATIAQATGLGGFLCTVAGTLNATDARGAVVSALTMLAGTYYFMPFATSGTLTVTLSGGAAGTLAYAQ